jgi:hypothetical protein
MSYPCESNPDLAKHHEMMKGAGKGQLKQEVDCAIDARDQWMKDLTDWLGQLALAVNECRVACGLPPLPLSPTAGTTSTTTATSLAISDPPKPPKDWP